MSAAEVAAELGCGERTVRERAAEHGIGANFGGRTGWRFTEDDITELLQAMRGKPRPRRQRRRRSA